MSLMPTQQRVSKRLSFPRHRGNILLLEHTAVPCPPQSKPCMCLLSMDTLATCHYYSCQCHQGMLTSNAASHSTHISHHGTAHLACSILYTRASRRPSTGIQRHPHSLPHAWQGLPTLLCPQGGTTSPIPALDSGCCSPVLSTITPHLLDPALAQPVSLPASCSPQSPPPLPLSGIKSRSD